MNNVNENKSGDNSLRDWFGKSRSSDGKPGWVQLGGKYAGKPCARQPGQTTKPKCGSSKMKRNLSKDEEERAFRRKNRKDPNPDRKGKAINVKTEELNTEAYNKGTGPIKVDVKKTMPNALKKVVQNLKDRENPIDKKIGEEFTVLPLNLEIPTNIRDFNLGLMFRESLDENSAMLFIFEASAKQSFHMKETRIPLDIAFVTEDGIIDSIKQLEPLSEEHVESDGEILYALEVNRGWFEEYGIEAGDEMMIEAAGEKDACYHKVKSRYSVWPSAYASGALVKCRKVGAANWGNKSKTKKEEYEISNWRDDFKPTDIESTDIIKPEPLEPTKGIGSDMLDEKCWKGYEKKGMKTMFGKRYPNCVKKEEVEEVREGDTEDSLRDKRMERGGVDGNTNYKKATFAPGPTGGKKKKYDGMSAVERVKADIEKKYGKGAIVDKKKEVKEAEVPNLNAYKDAKRDMNKPGEMKKLEDRSKAGRGKALLDRLLNQEFEPQGDSVQEAVRIPAKTGNIVMVGIVWRGKSYSIKMFFPQVSKPNRKEIQAQLDKVYPGSRVQYFVVSDYKPGEPVMHVEDWQKKSGKNPEGGLNEKGRKSYERENPGSDLKAPSKKVGNPRRKSFCARMKGMKKKLTSSKTANDPDSRINKSLRAWNC